jgi:hypothetical protein
MAIETTGLLVFTFKLVLTGDGSEGLPGWRRRFLSHGTFRQFPEKHAFWQLTTDQLNCALEALAKKTLVREPFDSVGSERSGSSPEPPVSGRTQSVALGSPQHSPVEDTSNEASNGDSRPIAKGPGQPRQIWSG